MSKPTNSFPTGSPPKPKDLDPTLYTLDSTHLQFFQFQTGIQDEDELKDHILSIQAKAYKIHAYPCIRLFSFLKLKISSIPGYRDALYLLTTRDKTPVFLDIGCCFGNDLRLAVSDGWPITHVIGSDLRKGFWEYGHELFKTTPQTFPAAFIEGDVFDPSFMPSSSSSSEAMDEQNVVDESNPNLTFLTSFHPLKHKISAIHASSLFHLFSESKQLILAKTLSLLLSPEKGSVIFGRHIASPTKGLKRKEGMKRTYEMFCHSPESWKELWMDEVFEGKGGVQVDADLVEIKRKDVLHLEPSESAGNADKITRFWLMRWCVKRA